jgi:hypothetical protein
MYEIFVIAVSLEAFSLICRLISILFLADPRDAREKLQRRDSIDRMRRDTVALCLSSEAISSSNARNSFHATFLVYYYHQSELL